MNKLHYVNVGYPRSGTTWLWKSLVDNPDMFKLKTSDFLSTLKTRALMRNFKEPKKFTFTSSNVSDISTAKNESVLIKDYEIDYREIYNQYETSMNMNAYYFNLDSDSIIRLSTFATHASLMIRNPFEAIASYAKYTYYRLMNVYTDTSLTVDFYIEQFDFPKHVSKWIEYAKHFKQFDIFYYSDLKDSPQLFYDKICDFLDIPRRILPSLMVKSSVNGMDGLITTFEEITQDSNVDLVIPKYKPVVFTSDQISKINTQIVELGIILNKDFSAWLR